MNATDTGRLAAAVAAAEAAGLGGVSWVQRARLMLDRRQKKDQQIAAAEEARLRALQKQWREEARKTPVSARTLHQ
jgi:uncharacterized protein HemX